MKSQIKAFLSGFVNAFGWPTYQDQIAYKCGEIIRRINAKIAPRRAETDQMMNEFNKYVNKSKTRKKKR